MIHYGIAWNNKTYKNNDGNLPPIPGENVEPVKKCAVCPDCDKDFYPGEGLEVFDLTSHKVLCFECREKAPEFVAIINLIGDAFRTIMDRYDNMFALHTIFPILERDKRKAESKEQLKEHFKKQALNPSRKKIGKKMEKILAGVRYGVCDFLDDEKMPTPEELLAIQKTILKIFLYGMKREGEIWGIDISKELREDDSEGGKNK
jgi:hypothetical protein